MRWMENGGVEKDVDSHFLIFSLHNTYIILRYARTSLILIYNSITQLDRSIYEKNERKVKIGRAGGGEVSG